MHAELLRRVQNAAFMRALWMQDAVEHNLDTADPHWQWAMFPNGIASDVHQARRAAENAHIPATDIAAAEELGSSGTPWHIQPAHQRLGRLEQLSRELYEAAERAEDLATRLNTAHITIAELHEDLAHSENTIRDLLNEVVDHDWATGNTRRNLHPAPDWPSALRQANTALWTANLLDALEPTPTPSTDDGPRTAESIDAALSGTDPGEWPVQPPPPEPGEPTSATGPEAEQ
ncbi:hypothetical protein K7711_36495 [Nocardia sp. CA2R105]|uniref:hypothetical protein n=1 Tax=Nocardia coffeae TaxID=2873381 RepID=UPI001CA76B39|nr:hypothetical protein [Nocardia coffeae]MBY8862024.1 hypothetical protein [Nocardia coffeae]